MYWRFTDRREAGQHLAKLLERYKERDDTIVLGLPRGGVPVAYEVARSISAPLDVFIVRKLGVPGQEEFAFGAIASGGITYLNDSVVNALKLKPETIERIIREEEAELERREKLYRGGREFGSLKGKKVIIVDDGLATGATMLAAIRALKEKEPGQIIVAVPVASRDTCREVETEADLLCACSMTPEPFYGVGMWYRDFSQTSDKEVIDLLAEARKPTEFHSAA